MKPEPITFVSAERFKDPQCKWVYRFPIPTNLHPNFGRMEVRLEPILKRGKIERMYLEFRQHEIPELLEHFDIPTPQADKNTGISTFNHSTGLASFYRDIWIIQPCAMHKALSICSYVPDGTMALVIELLTTSIGVHYDLRRGA